MTQTSSRAGVLALQQLLRGSGTFPWAPQAAWRGFSDAVPLGHLHSDLSPTACNAGLRRRKDLTLRSDVRLCDTAGSYTLKELLKDKIAIVFGVPDMGKVCSQKHVPSYIEKAKELSAAELDTIICVAVSRPEVARSWASDKCIDQSNVRVLADKTGAFARMLGVELAASKEGEQRMHRFAALVEDGVLLKMNVEQSPANTDKTDASAMLDVLRNLQALKE